MLNRQGFGNDDGVRDSIRRVFNEAVMPADGIVALAGFYRVLKPALLAAYRAFGQISMTYWSECRRMSGTR